MNVRRNRKQLLARRFKRPKSKQNELSRVCFVRLGRSAIRLALKNEYFSRRVALLPRYICQSVIDAFESFEVFFYDIGKDLSVCKSLFREIVNQIKPSVILTMPYFGFTTDKNIEKELSDCKDNGIILINDITQALFLGNNGIADYTVASLRKWFPIPDGGFLRSEKNIKLRSVNPQPSLSSTIRLEAMSEKEKTCTALKQLTKINILIYLIKQKIRWIPKTKSIIYPIRQRIYWRD